MIRTHRLLFICLFLHSLANGQTYIVKDSLPVRGSTMVIAGKEYGKGPGHRFIWGRGYRKEWTTAIRVPDFYLDTAFGGIKPYKIGGGRQTKSLRLYDKDSTEYVLRSVDKNFARALPDNFAGTFFAHVAKDQAVLGHPYAAVIITPMIEAAGIYHTVPRVVFVPRQPGLGEFDEEFGDQLYLLERRPDEDQRDAPQFGRALNVVGSEKLFEKVYEDNDHVVDQRTFLRARLFDMLIGDWGRHPDNWRWAEFDDGEITTYYPVPRDRDQAFSKIDGVLPDLAASIPKFRHLQGFGPDIKNVKKWNYPGWTLDRMFLNALPESAWIEEAKRLQHVISDDLIRRSVHRMPDEYFSISGEKLINDLISRRNHLEEYAKDYYQYLSHHVQIVGSDKREYFLIDRITPNKTSVAIYRMSKEREVADTPYYSRIFFNNETNEIRLYGLGKSDSVKVTGDEEVGVKLQLIDPEGEDGMTAKSVHADRDIHLYTGKAFQYDSFYTKKFDFFIRPILAVPAYQAAFDDDPLHWFPRTGLRVSGGFTYTFQPWRKYEYRRTSLFNVSYGVLRKAFNAGYVGEFGRLIGKWDGLVRLRVDAPAVENYFGVGNESELYNNTRNYFRTYSNRMFGALGLARNFKDQRVSFSGIFQTVKFERTPDHFITENKVLVDSTAFTRKYYAGAEATYDLLKVNDQVYPTSGFHISSGAAYMKNLKDSSRSFAKFMGRVSVYVPITEHFSFASRLGGGYLTGQADFYHLNKVGGNVDVRGYERERFYGTHSLFSNNDIRWVTSTHNIFFNGEIGLAGFFDIGRVWMEEDASKTWHPSYGGQFFIIPFHKVVLTAIMGFSREGNYLQLTSGMFF